MTNDADRERLSVWGSHAGDAAPETCRSPASGFVFSEEAPEGARFVFQGSKRTLAVAIASGVVLGALALAVPLSIALLVDTAVPAKPSRWLVGLVGALLAAAVAAAAVGLIHRLAAARLVERAGLRVHTALLERLFAQPVSFFQTHTSGDLSDRVQGAARLQGHVAEAVVTLSLAGAMAFLNFFLMFRLNVFLAGVAVLLVAAELAVEGVLARLVLRQRRMRAEKEGELQGLLLQVAGGIETLRAANAEDRAFGRWDSLHAEKSRLDAAIRSCERAVRALRLICPFVMALVLCAAYIHGSRHGEAFFGSFGTEALVRLSPGGFLALLVAAGLFLGASFLISSAAGLLAMQPAWERVAPILHDLPEPGGTSNPVDALGGELAASNITFRYGSDSPPVLHDVSIRAQPGELVAIVGPSGAGKSTLLRILLGLETPAAGTVCCDGKDLGRFDGPALRARIGVALEDEAIVAGSVLHNIALGASISLDDAWEAARLAGIAEDIRAMPMAMHTLLADGGGSLSEGQRQRLRIARALARRPRVLLLDEPLCAQGESARETLLCNLKRLGKTCVLFTRLPGGLANADRLYAMEQGEVTEPT